MGIGLDLKHEAISNYKKKWTFKDWNCVLGNDFDPLHQPDNMEDTGQGYCSRCRAVAILSNPKVLILGHGAHGKDTIADAVTRFTGLRFESSSMAAAEAAVFPELSKLYGYKTVQECFDDRRNHRQEWRELITAYNTPDKGRLCKEIIARCDGYIGMRCHEEFAAVRHLFDYVLWVDASLRVDPDPSMTIERDDGMIFIDNNMAPEVAWIDVGIWASREGLCSRR